MDVGVDSGVLVPTGAGVDGRDAASTITAMTVTAATRAAKAHNRIRDRRRGAATGAMPMNGVTTPGRAAVGLTPRPFPAKQR